MRGAAFSATEQYDAVHSNVTLSNVGATQPFLTNNSAQSVFPLSVRATIAAAVSHY